jgi:hypothetical protein
VDVIGLFPLAHASPPAIPASFIAGISKLCTFL